jgi:hypothetical protein
MNLPELPKPVQHEMEHGVCVGYMSVGQCIEYGQACFDEGVSSVHTQEPVAWMYTHTYPHNNIVRFDRVTYPDRCVDGWTETPLYTHPSPQQSAEPLELSDAIKRDLITNWFADWWTQKAAHGLLEDYASAVLAAANAKRKPA